MTTRSALGLPHGPDTTGNSILNVLLGISGAVLVITLLLCAWSWMRWRRLQAAAHARAAGATAAAKEAHLAEQVQIVIPVLVISPDK